MRVADHVVYIIIILCNTGCNSVKLIDVAMNVRTYTTQSNYCDSSNIRNKI